MNTETGQIKEWEHLTEAERKSGKGVKLPQGVKFVDQPMSQSDIRREEYMRQVLEKKKSGVNV